jgi:predicted RNA-binding protein with PIN domain
VGYKRQRLIIVDGYNVLRSGSRYKNVPADDFTDEHTNPARERLINDVINFAGKTPTYIVFDGGGSQNAQANVQKLGNISVVFSARGTSADRVIEKLAHDAKERGVETLVVSSDATIQDTVFGGVVDRMSADGFCREIADLESVVREEEAPAIARKNTVAGRIPKETAEALARLRDSL